MKRHIFCIYHPALIFLYFLAAIVCAMLTRHPVYIGISFAAASAYCVYLRGIGRYWRTLLMLLPMILVIASANALFSGMGVTLLFYAGGRPVTLEAFAYGVSSGFMLGAVLLWFQCYEEVMTNEKFLWLFGKTAPVSAMLISMIFKFIPETLKKAGQINSSQRALLGHSGEGGKRQDKKGQLAHGVRVASILMSWSMEGSIETADSMRARGYGLRKRTSFERYAFERHDRLSMAVLLALAAVSVRQIVGADGAFAFYPVISPVDVRIPGILCYATMLLYPLILEGREQLRWLRPNS